MVIAIDTHEAPDNLLPNTKPQLPRYSSKQDQRRRNKQLKFPDFLSQTSKLLTDNPSPDDADDIKFQYED
jgi:hypothetical protein